MTHITNLVKPFFPSAHTPLIKENIELHRIIPHHNLTQKHTFESTVNPVIRKHRENTSDYFVVAAQYLTPIPTCSNLMNNKPKRHSIFDSLGFWGQRKSDHEWFFLEELSQHPSSESGGEESDSEDEADTLFLSRSR